MTGPAFAALSDTGLVRPGNEDAWFADPARGVFLVSDGMGGQFAGEVASQIVVSTLPAMLRKVLAADADPSAPATRECVLGAISDLSNELRERTEHEPGLKGLGATLVLALVRGPRVLLAHMGDSRGCLWRAGVLRQLTKDHSLAQLLLDNGEVTPAEAQQHPARSHLTRFMGMPGEPLPEGQCLELISGDRLLLCTDGLTNMVGDEELGQLLGAARPVGEVCRGLIEAAKAHGGRDNITAVVIEAAGERP